MNTINGLQAVYKYFVWRSLVNDCLIYWMVTWQGACINITVQQLSWVHGSIRYQMSNT